MIAKSILQLHDLSSAKRIDLAAEQLSGGQGVVYQETWFLVDGGQLWCNAIHQGAAGAAPPAAVAENLMARSRDALRQLRGAHPAIDSLAATRPISYAIVEDYGQGVVALVCRVDGQLVFGLEAATRWRR